ncbi:MAG: group-specific protein [Planctomycetota bacterium]
MSLPDVELVVVVVKRDGVFRWYRSDRELWVLDLKKWHQEFVDAGYSTPDVDSSDRFGIDVVNDETIDHFLSSMSEFELDCTKLADALARRFPSAKSWWDVGKLFPVMFVDVDKRHVAAFYSNGIPMERYVPEGWTGEFEDFATRFSEEDFPSTEKFWIQDGVDMLAVLNERGHSLDRQ